MRAPLSVRTACHVETHPFLPNVATAPLAPHDTRMSTRYELLAVNTLCRATQYEINAGWGSPDKCANACLNQDGCRSRGERWRGISSRLHRAAAMGGRRQRGERWRSSRSRGVAALRSAVARRAMVAHRRRPTQVLYLQKVERPLPRVDHMLCVMPGGPRRLVIVRLLSARGEDGQSTDLVVWESAPNRIRHLDAASRRRVAPRSALAVRLQSRGQSPGLVPALPVPV